MSDGIATSSTGSGSGKKELPPGAIIPRHGGGMLRPWKPGQAGNPAGRRGDEYDETVRLARTASPDAMRKLIAKMDSDDERVATIAIQGVLDRAFGKPKEYDPNAAREAGASLDVANLTPAELEMILAITRRGAVQQAADPSLNTAPPIVDGVSTPVATPSKPKVKYKRKR